MTITDEHFQKLSADIEDQLTRNETPEYELYQRKAGANAVDGATYQAAFVDAERRVRGYPRIQIRH